jgi:hypothetical protein
MEEHALIIVAETAQSAFRLRGLFRLAAQRAHPGDRAVDVDSLPRDIIPKEVVSGPP